MRGPIRCDHPEFDSYRCQNNGSGTKMSEWVRGCAFEMSYAALIFGVFVVGGTSCTSAPVFSVLTHLLHLIRTCMFRNQIKSAKLLVGLIKHHQIHLHTDSIVLRLLLKSICVNHSLLEPQQSNWLTTTLNL